MTGRPLARLELGAKEEAALRSLASRRKTAQALALRARIVLAQYLTLMWWYRALLMKAPNVGSEPISA